MRKTYWVVESLLYGRVVYLRGNKNADVPTRDHIAPWWDVDIATAVRLADEDSADRFASALSVVHYRATEHQDTLKPGDITPDGQTVTAGLSGA